MKYRRVGKSGLKISDVSLGSWLTYGGTVEKQIAKDCMNAALEQGINFIDSAEIYAGGKAESVIGEWLVEENIDRKNLVISSKVFWPTSKAVTDWGNSRKNIMNAIDGTLERLGTDHIDIYYMHRFDPTTPVRETDIRGHLYGLQPNWSGFMRSLRNMDFRDLLWSSQCTTCSSDT
jgi:aryl-alcohol dehydrogenase-like predicted oxidoreductase